MNPSSYPVRCALVALLVLLYGTVCYHNITGSTIRFDAAENLELALNLAHHGVFSSDQQYPYRPSMIREPVPVLSMAAAVLVVDRVLGPAPPADYFSGPRARAIKLQNIVWMALLCAAVFYALHSLTDSFYLSLLGVVLINKIPFVTSGLVYAGLRVDTLYTELEAATLVVLGSALLARGVQRNSLSFAAAAGLVFGALALTKAALLYVLLLLILVMTAVAVHRRKRPLPEWPEPRTLAVLCVAFVAVVLPWMVRNSRDLGEFQVAGRGGMGLYFRAFDNQLTHDEMLATLYWWAPDPLTRQYFGHMLGLSPSDFLSRKGRMRRLSSDPGSEFYETDFTAMFTGHPDQAVSNFFKSFAEEQRIWLTFRGKPGVNEDVATDKLLLARGISLFRQEPLRDLEMTPLYMYRAAAYLFIALVGLLVHTLRTRRYSLLIMGLLGLMTLVFYAALSDFITRYAVPVVPLTLVAILAALYPWLAARPLRPWLHHALRRVALSRYHA